MREPKFFNKKLNITINYKSKKMNFLDLLITKVVAQARTTTTTTTINRVVKMIEAKAKAKARAKAKAKVR